MWGGPRGPPTRAQKLTTLRRGCDTAALLYLGHALAARPGRVDEGLAPALVFLTPDPAGAAGWLWPRSGSASSDWRHQPISMSYAPAHIQLLDIANAELPIRSSTPGPCRVRAVRVGVDIPQAT